MAQPVVDTLRLSDALQEAGVERTQAEGVARALGDELGEHVVARGDLDAGFDRVDAKLDVLRLGLEAVDSKLRYMMAGVGLMLAFLSAMTGIAVYQRVPAEAGPVSHQPWPAATPEATAETPAPGNPDTPAYPDD